MRDLLRGASRLSQARPRRGEGKVRPPRALESPKLGRTPDFGRARRDHPGQGQAGQEGDGGEPQACPGVSPMRFWPMTGAADGCSVAAMYQPVGITTGLTEGDHAGSISTAR